VADGGPSLASITPAAADTQGIARFPRWAMAGGLLNALLVAWLLAWWHDSFSLPHFAILLISAAYVAISALAAAAAARHYWRQAKFRSRYTLEELMLTWGAAWVWAPAVVLLLRRDLWWAPVIAALAAAVPACTMHWMRVKAERDQPSRETTDCTTRPLFAETLQPIPWDWRGTAIAICIYVACAAYLDIDTLPACAAAAIAAFLFAGQRAAALDERAEKLSSRDRTRGRLVWSAMLAVLVTMLALIAGKPSSGTSVHAVSAKVKKADINEPSGLGNYQSVILWPQKPEKQLILPPDLLPATPLTQKQTIHFTGVYWYFEAPATEPGPQAHIAHGNPMDVSIRTVNTRPLMMQAHQKLAEPIRLSSVRTIDITLQNRDNDRGLLSIGIILTDSALSNTAGVNLGLQPLPSTEPENFTTKTAPVTETLHFAIPPQAQAQIRRFDGITVLILPDPSRMHSGSRVAIDRFNLEPR